MTQFFHKSGLLTIRDGRILLCRKRSGTQLLILPGGCIEPGESHGECLRREIREELGDVTLRDVQFIATYESEAAGGGTVRIDLFCGSLDGEPVASGEIAELVWWSLYDDKQCLAPSIRTVILPDLIARGWFE